MVEILCRDLDRGEAEAIVLALELKSKWLLLDERDARKIEKSLGLRVTGILGILLRAVKDQKLSSIEPEISVEGAEKTFLKVGHTFNLAT